MPQKRNPAALEQLRAQSSLVLSETLSMFLVTFALWQAIRIGPASLRRFAVFGAVMSVVALIRPAFAAIAPALPAS